MAISELDILIPTVTFLGGKVTDTINERTTHVRVVFWVQKAMSVRKKKI